MSVLVSLVKIAVFCKVAMSAPATEIVDLGYEMSNETESWPGIQKYNVTLKTRQKNENGIPWYADNTYEASEHVGTHLDAPFHMSEVGWKVGDIPLKRFFVPGVLLDVSHEVKDNDFELEVENIKEWEGKHCVIPEGSVVLVRFGLSSLYYDNRTKYFGFVNNTTQEMHFPGLSKNASKYLAETRKVYGVGVDTPSLDPGVNPVYEAHRTLFEKQIFGIENLNLKKDVLPATGFKLHIMPMKIKEGTGAPCRVIAFLDHRSPPEPSAE